MNIHKYSEHVLLVHLLGVAIVPSAVSHLLRGSDDDIPELHSLLLSRGDEIQSHFKIGAKWAKIGKCSRVHDQNVE